MTHVLLAIATNLSLVHMTGFVVQDHTSTYTSSKPAWYVRWKGASWNWEGANLFPALQLCAQGLRLFLHTQWFAIDESPWHFSCPISWPAVPRWPSSHLWLVPSYRSPEVTAQAVWQVCCGCCLVASSLTDFVITRDEDNERLGCMCMCACETTPSERPQPAILPRR